MKNLINKGLVLMMSVAFGFLYAGATTPSVPPTPGTGTGGVGPGSRPKKASIDMLDEAFVVTAVIFIFIYAYCLYVRKKKVANL